MRRPHASIAMLMAIVAIVALDCYAVRLFRGHSFHPFLTDLILFGALPMANLLAIALFLLAKRPGVDKKRPRPFLVGFVAGGAAALIVFLALAVLATDPIHEGVGYVVQTLVPHGGPLFVSVVATIILLPQLALALLAGWLNLVYRISITIAVERRPGRDLEPGAISAPRAAVPGSTM